MKQLKHLAFSVTEMINISNLFFKLIEEKKDKRYKNDLQVDKALISYKATKESLFNKCVAIQTKQFPKIICLCGSTRFMNAFQQANLKFTLQGHIILTVGCNTRSDAELFSDLPIAEQLKIKQSLDELHKRKIDLCDEVFVLNVGGYIGESTRSEIEYAIAHDKIVRYLEEAPLNLDIRNPLVNQL